MTAYKIGSLDAIASLFFKTDASMICQQLTAGLA